MDVRPGRIATSDNGEDVLHFELVDLDVIRGLKGVKTAERITGERTAAFRQRHLHRCRRR